MYPNPFVSLGFAGFWLRVEREWAEEEKRYEIYDPWKDNPCAYCDDWYNCPDCPARLEQEAEDEAEEQLAREECLP